MIDCQYGPVYGTLWLHGVKFFAFHERGSRFNVAYCRVWHLGGWSPFSMDYPTSNWLFVESTKEKILEEIGKEQQDGIADTNI